MSEAVSGDCSERRSAVARDMRRRLVSHLAAGGATDTAAGVLENDCSVYTDSARAKREKRLLFGRLPLLAGLSGDVRAPGDCLLFEAVGAPVVIVRGDDGRLRAFRNMCTHRGSKLVREDQPGKCSSRRRLVCPFHGWSFDLAGALAGVPGRKGFGPLDPGSRGLLPVGCAEWEGLIFVQAEASTIETPSFLGSFAPEMAQLELERLERVRTGRVRAETDWKLALDTYCEGYHFGTLHRSTLGHSHHSNVAVFDDFAPHWRLGFAGRDLDPLVGRPESAWPEPAYGCIYFLFPNAILVVGELAAGERCLRVFRVFPGDEAGTMSCEISVYAPASVARDSGRVEREFAYDDAESEITKEDYSVATEAYRNLKFAPEGHRVVYGRNEPALQAFHRAVAKELGETL